MVRSPDGKQVTQAVVPYDCEPGKSFFVSFPTYQPDNHHAGCVTELDQLLTPQPNLLEVTATRVPTMDDGRTTRLMEVNEGHDVEGRPAPTTVAVDNNSIRDSPETTPNSIDPEEQLGSVRKPEPPAAASTLTRLANLMDKTLHLDDDDDDGLAALAQSPSMGAATAPPRINTRTTQKLRQTTNKSGGVRALPEENAKAAGNESSLLDENPPIREVMTPREEAALEQKVLLVRVPPGVVYHHPKNDDVSCTSYSD